MPYKIFDICGTLYNSNTTLDFCEYRCRSSKKIILKLSKTFIGKMINKFLIEIFSYDYIRSIHIGSLKGVTLERLEAEAESFTKKYLIQKKILETHEILNNFDKKYIFLISATIDPVAKAIAKELGDLNYISTKLEYRNGKCIGRIGNDLLGKKQNYFKNKKIELVVTDNVSDIELCKIANEVVIISKPKKLKFWKKQSIAISKIIKV